MPLIATERFYLVELKGSLVGTVGIELLFNFTKSRVFTVLPTASQMELTNTSVLKSGGRCALLLENFRRPLAERVAAAISERH
jgi:hypothetical protein